MALQVSHKTLRVLLCSLAAGLTACAPYAANNYVANGYRYQDMTPLSSPAPTRPWVSSAKYNADVAMMNEEAWKVAVNQLVTSLAAKMPAGQQALYLKAPQSPSASDQAFDHYLRQALLEQDYLITTSPQNAVVVAYDTAPLKTVEAKQRAEAAGVKAQNSANALLTLVAMNGKDVLAKESLAATIPGEKQEYARFPGFSTVPSYGEAARKVPVYETR